MIMAMARPADDNPINKTCRHAIVHVSARGIHVYCFSLSNLETIVSISIYMLRPLHKILPLDVQLYSRSFDFIIFIFSPPSFFLFLFHINSIRLFAISFGCFRLFPFLSQSFSF